MNTNWDLVAYNGLFIQVPVDDVDEMLFKQALSAPVVAVASPSAVR